MGQDVIKCSEGFWAMYLAPVPVPASVPVPEPKGVKGFRCEGVIRRKGLSVHPHPSAKGVVMLYQKEGEKEQKEEKEKAKEKEQERHQTKPAKIAMAQSTLGADSRRVSPANKLYTKNFCRTDLKNRASVILLVVSVLVSIAFSQEPYRNEPTLHHYDPIDPVYRNRHNPYTFQYQNVTPAAGRTQKCKDLRGRPQRCVPEFVNAAYERPVEATNTCGIRGPLKYCLQTGATDSKKTCEICDARDRSLSHPPSYLTDFNDNNVQTWWQSETMYEGVQSPNPDRENYVNQINLTLHLGKAFDITYIRLKFQSPRPESFAIYKMAEEDGDWIPFQYYSGTCNGTYSVLDKSYVSRNNETLALCTSEFSDISPLTGGNVIFTTLEGRPSAHDFENSHVLQEFVTATDIRITLDRMNTFGEEIFGDSEVLRSYYYAISDLSVGGICKCNGHSSECIAGDSHRKLKCKCEHLTAGPDCNECLPFYNDQPWSRATATDAHECKACNCNGKAQRCFFDQELWRRTGHGGHCLDCAESTDGPNCERCRENYYQTLEARCVACNCDPIGSISLQCNSQGQCLCKPGVEGQRCDACAPNHYDFSPQGCKSCGCSVSGSWNNTATCDPRSGQCRCKANIEGQHCELCKPGYFDLQAENEFGCLPCFCFGHSSVCISAPGYSKYSIESSFTRDSEKWTVKDRANQDVPFQFNAIVKNIGVKASSRDPLYFIAPERYLGDQKSSYNQFLSFTFRIGEEGPRATFQDVTLEGSGLTISQPIFGQGNPLPQTRNQQYRFRLHEDGTLYGWSPRLNAKDFISVLSNLTAIKIRATYSSEGSGFIDDVRLDSAQQLAFGGQASWIEMCTCPPGYVGQFCESCAPGFRHNPPGGGNFGECIPCNCNGHAEFCDPDSGRCICEHNTGGDNCDKCGDGFYGNAVQGTTSDCQPCPCPDKGACVVLPDEQVACLQCPAGYAGHRCDHCVDGYFGSPTGSQPTTSRMCRECNCNKNVDRNAVGNCDTITGECLKCIYNTYGSQCEKCLPGYYGDALAVPQGNCRACGCHPQGTYRNEVAVSRKSETAFLCNSGTGQCTCLSNVMGRQCDRCVDGYWNMASGEGCTACNCNLVGSFNRTCDDRSGQCYCRPGITGQQCDKCLPLHFGFSTKGCQACDCDPIGSTSSQCDDRGQCPCQPNVEGRRCERCRENKQNKIAGCVDCPVCYTLVQDAVSAHRLKLGELSQLLDEIEKNPQVVEDLNFEQQLSEVMLKVDSLLGEARRAQGSDGSLTVQLKDLKIRIQKVQEIAEEVNGRQGMINGVVSQGERNITLAEDIIERAQEALANAKKILDTEGLTALEKARERSKKFGQQSERMSEIARQARQLADRHQQEADTIEGLAKEAFNTSQEAHRLANEAIRTQRDNNKEIERLQKQVSDTTDLLLRTRKMADEAKKEATKAYNDALEIYTDINSITVPGLESDKLRQDALDLIDQAQRILKEADDLLQKNAETLNATEYQHQDAKDLLEEASRQQRITDELLVDAYAALGKANESIAAGEATLADAKKTLDTLKEFDKLVQESKGKADEALKKVKDIRDLIDEAENKTTDAERALGGALQDAIEARDVALEAQKIAERASQDATRIREEANSTKLRASKLKNQAQVLSENVDNTASRMKEYEDQAAKDEKLVKDALERADQAKTSALEASKKVKNALDTVDGINDALDDVADIDANLLAELEKRLVQAEQELKNANLDNRLGDLKQAKDQQQQWMRNYDAEIEKLKSDVANIKIIRDALPKQCYRRVRLEP